MLASHCSVGSPRQLVVAVREALERLQVSLNCSTSDDVQPESWHVDEDLTEDYGAEGEEASR